MTEEDRKGLAVVAPDEDLGVVATSGPAIFVTRCLLTVGDVVRIAFADQPARGKPIQFRTAVAMTVPQAIALKNLLALRLGPLEAALAEAKAAKAEAAQDTDSEPDVEK